MTTSVLAVATCTAYHHMILLLPTPFCLAGSHHHNYMVQGQWVIAGLLLFLLLEKMFPDQKSNAEPAPTAGLNATASVSFISSIAHFTPLCCECLLAKSTSFTSMQCNIIASYVIFKYCLMAAVLRIGIQQLKCDYV